MFCNKCGIEIADGMTACPNCGTPVGTAADEVVVTPAPQPGQTAQPGQAMPGMAPGMNPAPGMPQQAPYPLPDIPADADQRLIQQAQQKKKKNHGCLIAILIAVFFLIAAAAVIAVIVLSIGKKVNSAMDVQTEYWDANIACDETAYDQMIPAQFWGYIEENYDCTKEEALDGQRLVMDETAHELGGEMTYSVVRSSTVMGSRNSDNIATIRSKATEWGLDIDYAVGQTMNVTVSGEEDDVSYDNLTMWALNMDGVWYNSTAMADIIDACENGYVEKARLNKKYSGLLIPFWQVMANADGNAMLDYVPQSYIDSLTAQFDELGMVYDESKFGEYLSDYLSDLMTSVAGSEMSNVDVELDILGETPYEGDKLEEAIQTLKDENGIEVEEITEIAEHVKLMPGDDPTPFEETDTNQTLFKIDGEWYVNDALYYFGQALYVGIMSEGVGTEDGAASAEGAQDGIVTEEVEDQP